MEELIALIRRELEIHMPVRADTPLISSGLVNSLRVEALLCVLEEKYGIVIDPTEIGTDNFDTAAQIHAFLESKS
jgi:acyl carrier protein